MNLERLAKDWLSSRRQMIGRISKLETDVEDLRERLVLAQQEKTQALRQSDELRKEKERLRQRTVELKKEEALLKAQISELGQKVQALKAANAELEKLCL